MAWENTYSDSRNTLSVEINAIRISMFGGKWVFRMVIHIIELAHLRAQL